MLNSFQFFARLKCQFTCWGKDNCS